MPKHEPPEPVNRRAEGQQAESEAASWLSNQGYKIVERNVFTPVGELDLVAYEGDTLCFIEVKARRSNEFGEAIEAVHRNKQRRIIKCAQYWLLYHPWDGDCRFDVVGMDQGGEGAPWRFTLVQNAFEV